MKHKKPSEPSPRPVLAVVEAAATQAKAQISHGQRFVKALVFGEEGQQETPEGATRSLAESDFQGVVGQILDPPYDPYALVYIAETNGILSAAVEAYQSNIESFGFRLVPRVDINGDGIPDETKGEAQKERFAVLNFLAATEPEGGFIKLRRDTRADREYTGCGYWEVVRDRKEGVAEFHHIPSPQMRLCPEDEEFVRVTRRYLQQGESGEVTIKSKPIYRRFRRFVQAAYIASSSTTSSAATGGTRIVWFKEYGDPRVLDSQTGKFYAAGSLEVTQDFDRTGRPMPEDRRASEVLYFSRYWPRTPYGVPRWIGSILAAVGARAAAEVNFVTLRNNNIPSLLLTVSNGRLTAATVERIRTFFDTHVRGNANFSQVLVLEGEGEYEGDESNHVKIEAKPLAASQHTDALFVEYTKQSNADLLHTFRLPPLFVGDQEAFNRATAEVSRRLTDEQVFAPERDEFDYRMNEILVRELGIRYWRFASRTPNVTDNRDLVAMLAAAERTGGSTPRIARLLLSDVLQDVDGMPSFDASKFDPDVPFSLTLAKLIQTKAIPTETGQTVAPVMPSAVVPGADAGRAIEKEFSLDLLKDIMALGDKATTELEVLFGRG